MACWRQNSRFTSVATGLAYPTTTKYCVGCQKRSTSPVCPVSHPSSSASSQARFSAGVGSVRSQCHMPRCHSRSLVEGRSNSKSSLKWSSPTTRPLTLRPTDALPKRNSRADDALSPGEERPICPRFHPPVAFSAAACNLCGRSIVKFASSCYIVSLASCVPFLTRRTKPIQLAGRLASAQEKHIF
jgi:hypothetical protein